jgi:hypothetical protein
MSMIVVGGLSIIHAVESTAARIAGGLFVLLGLITVSVIRTCKAKAGQKAGLDS